MTGDSLSVFSRVRLYTAIYPEGDVADSTESFFCDRMEPRTDFPVLSLRELALKRLPSVNPLRYQSPIALVLGARLKISPATIAQTICQESVAKKGGVDLSWNQEGWITLTWDPRAFWGALAEICDGEICDGVAEWTFEGWRVADRVRSLRSQLLLLHPEFSSAVWGLGNGIERMPDPVQDLLEAMVDFFDRRSEGKSGLGEWRSLWDGFEQMHRQIPLFSVATSVDDRYAVWLVLGWFQQILKLRETTDK
jgi:hypothetical protein